MIDANALSRRLRRLLAAPIAAAGQVPGADAYRKHFTAESHLWLLVWHGLAASPSLRQTHAAAAVDPQFWAQLDLQPTGVSRAQLARSSHSRPVDCMAQLLATLRNQVTSSARASSPLHLVDSSFLTLSAKLAPWSRHGKHAPGVRMHTGYDLGAALPSHLTLSLADTADITAFRARDWADLRGWTVLMDLGYYSHQTFAALREADVSWVCPLHDQARVDVTAAWPGVWERTRAGDEVLADQTITLGSPNNRGGAVVPDLRLVTSRNATGAIHRTVTDRFDLTAPEAVMLYRQRWQIELFFRWLKHQLGVLHPLGYSPQAVMLTLLVAAIIAVLAILLASDRPGHISDIAWVRMLGHALLLLFLRGG